MQKQIIKIHNNQSYGIKQVWCNPLPEQNKIRIHDSYVIFDAL